MLNYVREPIYAVIGIVDGVISRAADLLQTIRGRHDTSDETDVQPVEADSRAAISRETNAETGTGDRQVSPGLDA